MGANSPVAPGGTTAEGDTNIKATSGKGESGTGIPDSPGWYILGARSSEGQPPPRENITFGGQSFPEWCYDENPTIKNDSIEYNQRRRGQRVYLDAEDLKRLRDNLGKKIVRVRSEKGNRYAIISADSKAAMRKLRGDKPLEAFIYMTPAEAPHEVLPPEADAPPPIA